MDACHLSSLSHLGRLLHSEAIHGPPRSPAALPDARQHVWEMEGFGGAEGCLKRALRIMPIDPQAMSALAAVLIDSSLIESSMAHTCQTSQAHALTDQAGAQQAGVHAARRLDIAEGLLRRACMLSEHLAAPWLVNPKLPPLHPCCRPLHRLVFLSPLVYFRVAKHALSCCRPICPSHCVLVS